MAVPDGATADPRPPAVEPGGGPHEVRRGERGEALRLAFAEFLGGALAFSLGILALGVAGYALDRARPEWLEPVRNLLAESVFPSAETSSSLLQMIAQTVITVASITFSLLLVAIQQSASSFTAQVFDQFLRRRSNQFYLGFFVGLGALALLQAASVHPGFNPVFGAGLTLALSVVAVGMLLVLVYSAIDQMRPVVIVEAIHDHLIEARARQLQEIVARTRREPELSDVPSTVVTSHQTGFVMRIDLDAIQRAIETSGSRCEVVLEVAIGTFVAYGDPLARVATEDEAAARPVARAVEGAVRRERQRNIDRLDAGYGLEQLETVGWTSISGANHNPGAARLVVAQLRDVLARLVVEQPGPRPRPDTAIVYRDDVPEILMATVESLAVVTADSQQHQVAADIVATFAGLLERLPEWYRRRAVSVLMRTLPALASHPPTLVLERALRSLRDELARIGADEAAGLIDEGLGNVRERIGSVDSEYAPR